MDNKDYYYYNIYELYKKQYLTPQIQEETKVSPWENKQTKHSHVKN